MNVLVNTASVQFGNLRYDSHATAVRVDLGLLPSVGTITVTLPPQVEVSAAPGDEAKLSLNNGEGAKDVLTGTVQRVSRGPRRTEVVAADAGAALGAARFAKSFQDMSPGDVISNITGDLGLDAQTLLMGVDIMPLYVADQRRTGAQHVARLAELGGGFAHVDAGGTVQAAPWPFLPPTRALLQGREVIDYLAHSQAGEPDVAFIGASPAAAGADPRALAQSTEPVTGGADDPGTGLEWQSRPMLRSALGVNAAAEGARGARAARAARMEATCWLQPDLRPGDVIEVQGLDDGISGGPWLLTHIEHDMRRNHGGLTRIKGVSAEGPSLLGALGDAIGGLF